MKKQSPQPNFLKRSIYNKISSVFFPVAENDYKPKVLRSQPLNGFIVSLVMVKVLATLLLFFLYPDFANMSTDIYDRIIQLTNQSRIENGLNSLNIDEELNKAAQAKAEDMVLKGYFNHDTSEGKKPWQWINKSKYDYVNAGENLAMDFNSADIVHMALMKSASHRKNILNYKFEDIGISILTGEINNKKTMVMVEMFGRRREGTVATLNAPESNNKVIKEVKTIKEVKDTPVVNKVDENTELKNAKNIVNNSNIGIVKNNSLLSSDRSVGHSSVSMANTVAINSDNLLAVKGVSFSENQQTISKQMTKFKTAKAVSKYSTYLLYVGLGFLVLVLVLNILINIKIQHPVLIAHSLFVITIILTLAISKLHFIQKLIGSVVLG